MENIRYAICHECYYISKKKKYESIAFTYVPAIRLNELNRKEIVQLEEQDW
jgi:hypothetical protein